MTAPSRPARRIVGAEAPKAAEKKPKKRAAARAGAPATPKKPRLPQAPIKSGTPSRASLRRGAIATVPVAHEAALRVLEEGGSAVDAVLAGFFALAGIDRGALLAPATLLVAGVGAGARAFDGRAVQPGRGADRPRGFLAGAAVPAAARAAAPRSIGMALLAHAQRGRVSLSRLVADGVALAAAQGADGRATLLRRVGREGVSALHRADFVEPALAVAGLGSFGLLTEEDLREAGAEEVAARAASVTPPEGEALRVSIAPFPTPGELPSHLGPAVAVLAIDSWGLAAGLACHPSQDGCTVGGYEVLLPPVAVPVMRSKTRVGPGTALPIPGSLAAVDGGDALRVMLAAPGGAFSLPAVAAAALAHPLDAALAELDERVIGLVGGPRSVRPLARP